MALPGFTAEAGLREAKTGYRAKAVSPGAGGVVPQLLRPTITICWAAGGYSGCFTLPSPNAYLLNSAAMGSGPWW
jgi:hypothetical protein